MSVLTSSLNTANRAMSPITTYPQSGGVALEQSNNFRSKRTASPQRVPNGFSPGKSSSILSPRKTSKRFFRRPTQDKNQAVDVQPQGNEKKKPRVEIIYRDPPSESESDKETVVASLKKAFEVDGTSNLRSSSTLSGEWSPSTISEESAPTAPQTQCLDLNMNRVSSGSNISHTDRVVQEIVYTEQAYVKHLQEIIEGYLMNMRKENSPFDKQDVKDLFMNIEEIYEFNKEFVAELEECDEDPVEMAIKFASKEEGFATYTDYCTNYPLSMEVLTKCTQRQETAEFIKNIQVGLGHALPLGSYLLKPVQRILKYHLLLEDIQKHFDKESDTEGYDMVSDALSAMTSVAQHINEMKRQHEVAVHVQEIQSQMSDFEGPDLTTYGSLVLEDSFRVHGTRSDRYLFLFEQILLITKRKENGYSCKATLMLSNMMMVPKEPLAFQIIRFDNQKVNYTFLARNADQKRRWSLELKRLIVDSLAASVPISTKDKARILGEKSKEETGVGEPLECEGKKRSGSLDGKLNRGMLPRGSSFETKKDACRKSDDEGEPRSPTDICSSDDDKKPFHSQPHQTSREESLEEEPSEEKPLGTGTTECEESQSPAEPVDVRVGDWEKRLSFHNDGYRRISPTIHESSEEEEEEELQSPEDSGEQAKTYLIEDAQGEILGRASPYDNGMANEKEIVTEDSVACPSESQPKAKPESIKVGVPVLRERSGSLPESNALQMSRNDSVTMSRNHSVTEKPTFQANEAVENEPANELRGLGFARVRSEGPGRTPRRTSSLKLLEANRSAEKSSSALDLRDIDEETSTVFNDSEVTSFVDHSAIQKTVRKVSRAFSGSSTPTEKSPPSEAQMRSAQTRYLVESRASEVSPTDKDMSVTSSDSSQHSLEEMLASIDRDLEDTRRTITCAQLLESALLIKNEGKPLAGQPTDSLRRRGRSRIIDFSVNDKDGLETNSPHVKNTNSPVFKRANGGEDRVDYSSVESQKPRRRIADFSGNTRIVEEKLSRSHEQDLRAEVKSRADAVPSRASHAEEKVDTRVRSNSQSKRRVFELFADGNHDEREHLGDQENEASTEAKTPENSKLPSVYQMARQYSQKVTDKKTVDNVRMRIRSTVRERTGSETLCSDEDTTDHTPKITIERVKKVSINNTPIEAYKLVRRRKRRSGSSRHRSDDVRRSSWSVEKVKPDSESPLKERPKSVYDMEALEATLTENLEQIEEGMEPMLIDGLERDDVVVRGLVQHLVGKFNCQRSNATS